MDDEYDSDYEEYKSEDKNEIKKDDNWENRSIIWDDELQKYNSLIGEPKTKDITPSDEINIYQKVQEIFQKQEEKYLNSLSGSIEETLIRRGTSKDKISSLCLQVNKGGIYVLNFLDKLLKVCKDKQYRRCSQSIEGICSLFLYHLIPVRKMKLFTENNLYFLKKSKIKERKRILILWYFENELKKRMVNFINILNEHLRSNKSIDTLRHFVLRIFRILMFRLPESRDTIRDVFFTIIKSPKNKLTNKVLYYFSTMINPKRLYYCFIGKEKALLVKAVINLIFSFHSDVVVNAIKLLRAFNFDKETEMQLILLRVRIFLKIIQNFSNSKKKVNLLIMSRMLRTVAFAARFTPYDILKDYIDVLFNISRKSHFSTSVESSRILFDAVKKKESNEKLEYRYYVMLYDTLIKFDGFSYSQSAKDFIQLVKYSIFYDTNQSRSIAFCKRLIQSCYFASSQFTLNSIMVLQEIVQRKPYITKLFDADFKEAGGKIKYNLSSINPGKSCAESTKFWEMLGLTNHFHPMVDKFSKVLLNNERKSYSGDPMKDLTTSSFLETFTLTNNEDDKEKEEELKENKVFKEDEYFIRQYQNNKTEEIIENNSQLMDDDEMMTDNREEFLNSFEKKKLSKNIIDFNDNEIENVFLETGMDLQDEEFQPKRKKRKTDDLNMESMKLSKGNENKSIFHVEETKKPKKITKIEKDKPEIKPKLIKFKKKNKKQKGKKNKWKKVKSKSKKRKRKRN